MALVATTDKRLKAIATVSGMMGNKASYFETMDRETVTGLIAMQNAGRQRAYETGEVEYVDALGFEAEVAAIAEGATPSEGYDYYMTERAGAVTYPNYTHLSPAFMLEAPMLADATSYAPYIYTPYLGIVGTERDHAMFLSYDRTATPIRRTGQRHRVQRLLLEAAVPSHRLRVGRAESRMNTRSLTRCRNPQSICSSRWAKCHGPWPGLSERRRVPLTTCPPATA